jgi:hypothetical protein
MLSNYVEHTKNRATRRRKRRRRLIIKYKNEG